MLSCHAEQQHSEHCLIILLPLLQDLALKLRAEGRSYDPKVFKQKKQQKDGGKHPKAKVKIKSSQRNKAPYNVRKAMNQKHHW